MCKINFCFMHKYFVYRVFLEPKPPKPKTEIKKEVKNENVGNDLAPLEAPQMVDGVLLPQRLFAVGKSIDINR